MNLAEIATRFASRIGRVPEGLQNLPGPSPRFPIGSAVDFALRPPWQMTSEFSERYGAISLAWLGPMPMVMVHDPDLIARVLVEGDTNGDVYKAEPVGALSVISLPNTSAFVQNGAEHARTRRGGMTSHPAYAKWLDETSDMVVELAVDRAEGDLATPGRGFDQRVFRFMFDAVTRSVVGHEFDDAVFAAANSVFRTVDLRMRTNAPIVLPNFFRARKRWWGAFQRRVEAERAGQKLGGLVSHMLPGTRLSNEQFAVAMANVYPGGYFSTTAVLLNALVSLARDPDLLASLRTAILEDRAKHGPPTRARLEALLPLEQLIRETLRVYTPVPIFMRRVGIEPLKLGEHELAPNTIIAMGPGPLHLAKDKWDQAERFMPSRWTPELMAERPYGSAWFFPFGRGPRECEGRDVALTLIRASLYGMLSTRRLELDGSGPAKQKFYFAVMMPHKVSGAFVR